MSKLLNLEWAKVFKGALIAGAGAVLTYASQFFSGIEFGVMAPIVTAILSVAVNFVRKLAK